MRYLKLFLPVAVIAVGVLFNASTSFAKPEYAKKEKKGCVYCHPTTKGGKEDKDLTKAGKYYRDHNHSLEGYKAE